MALGAGDGGGDGVKEEEREVVGVPDTVFVELRDARGVRDLLRDRDRDTARSSPPPPSPSDAFCATCGVSVSADCMACSERRVPAARLCARLCLVRCNNDDNDDADAGACCAKPTAW